MPQVLITLNASRIHPPLIIRAILKHSGLDLAGSKVVADSILKDKRAKIMIGSVDKARMLIHELGVHGVSSVMVSE